MFSRRLSYAKHIDGVYVSLNDGTLLWLAGGVEVEPVAPEDVPAVMRDLFGADPALYLDAAEIHARYMATLAA